MNAAEITAQDKSECNFRTRALQLNIHDDFNHLKNLKIITLRDEFYTVDDSIILTTTDHSSTRFCVFTNAMYAKTPTNLCIYVSNRIKTPTQKPLVVNVFALPIKIPSVAFTIKSVSLPGDKENVPPKFYPERRFSAPNYVEPEIDLRQISKRSYQISVTLSNIKWCKSAIPEFDLSPSGCTLNLCSVVLIDLTKYNLIDPRDPDVCYFDACEILNVSDEDVYVRKFQFKNPYLCIFLRCRCVISYGFHPPSDCSLDLKCYSRYTRQNICMSINAPYFEVTPQSGCIDLYYSEDTLLKADTKNIISLKVTFASKEYLGLFIPLPHETIRPCLKIWLPNKFLQIVVTVDTDTRVTTDDSLGRLYFVPKRFFRRKINSAIHGDEFTTSGIDSGGFEIVYAGNSVRLHNFPGIYLHKGEDRQLISQAILYLKIV